MILPSSSTTAVDRSTDARGTTLTPTSRPIPGAAGTDEVGVYVPPPRKFPDVKGPPATTPVWRTPGGPLVMDKDALWSNSQMIDSFSGAFRDISPENQLWTAGLPIGAN